MGACTSGKQRSSEISKMQVSDFKFVQLLGKGTSGSVWKVADMKNHCFYALKIMDKVKIISSKSVKTTMLERQLLAHLSEIQTSFLSKMRGSFQDENQLYLLMDLIEGESLRTYLNNGLQLSQEQIKSFTLCMLKALEHLYNSKIIHRDVKPQNIIINQLGHPYLIDFGISSFYSVDNNDQSGGSLGYMPPEIIALHNHNYTVDYFALGIIVFQLFFQRRPYQSRNKEDFLHEFSKKPMNKQKFPQLQRISPEASDFISRVFQQITQLLQKKPQKRLGYKLGVIQLKSHPWVINSFQKNLDSIRIDWSKIEQQQLLHPYLNEHYPNKFVYDSREQKFSKILSQGPLQCIKCIIQELFKGYDYLPMNHNQVTLAQPHQRGKVCLKDA